MSDRRPSDVRWTSVGRPSDVLQKRSRLSVQGRSLLFEQTNLLFEQDRSPLFEQERSNQKDLACPNRTNLSCPSKRDVSCSNRRDRQTSDECRLQKPSIRRTSTGRPTDVRRTSDERPMNFDFRSHQFRGTIILENTGFERSPLSRFISSPAPHSPPPPPPRPPRLHQLTSGVP